MTPPTPDLGRDNLTELLLVRIDERTATSSARVSDHEDRLRALERWRYGLPVAAVSSVLTLAATLAQVIR